MGLVDDRKSSFLAVTLPRQALVDFKRRKQMEFNKKVEENHKARCTEGSAGDKSHAVPDVARVL